MNTKKEAYVQPEIDWDSFAEMIPKEKLDVIVEPRRAGPPLGYDYLQNKLVFLHGHGCVHELLRSPVISTASGFYEYNAILYEHPFFADGQEVVWAIHPFSIASPTRYNYNKVCKDFGYGVRQVEHDWNHLSVDELWELVQTWEWKEQLDHEWVEYKRGVSEGIQYKMDPYDAVVIDGPAMEWYRRIFKGRIPEKDWINLVTGGDAYIKVGR